MNKALLETPSPQECSSTIFEISGTKFDPEIATDIWAKIRPSLTDEIIEEFQKDSITYSRT